MHSKALCIPILSKLSTHFSTSVTLLAKMFSLTTHSTLSMSSLASSTIITRSSRPVVCGPTDSHFLANMLSNITASTSRTLEHQMVFAPQSLSRNTLRLSRNRGVGQVAVKRSDKCSPLTPGMISWQLHMLTSHLEGCYMGRAWARPSRSCTTSSVLWVQRSER